jgi:hypothetical protein
MLTTALLYLLGMYLMVGVVIWNGSQNLRKQSCLEEIFGFLFTVFFWIVPFILYCRDN